MTKPTREQEKLLSICVYTWHQTQLSTKQYTNEDIVDSVDKLYQSIGKSKPKKIVILDSPVQCAQYIKDHNITIENPIYDSIRKFIIEYTGNFVYYSIYESVKEYIVDSISDSLSFFLYYSCKYHTFNYSILWSIYLDYCINILKIKELKQYKTLFNLSEKVFYASLEDDIVIICRKLKNLHLDDCNRLHGDGIKAYEFNDGYGEYFNHGNKISTK